jgi:putative flippase GtrA
MMTPATSATNGSTFRDPNFRRIFLRWGVFNIVGLIGIGVQLVMLVVLKGWLGIHYLAATVLAVEAAILHNFIWHERWTWVDRTAIFRPT